MSSEIISPEISLENIFRKYLPEISPENIFRNYLPGIFPENISPEISQENVI